MRRVNVLIPLCLSDGDACGSAGAAAAFRRRMFTINWMRANRFSPSSRPLTPAGTMRRASLPRTIPCAKPCAITVKAQHLPVVAELKRYVRDHRPKTAEADLSQYISYALVMNGPPDFALATQSATVPPDVEALYEFTPLLVEFYREAQHRRSCGSVRSRTLTRRSRSIRSRCRGPSCKSNAYLRNTTSGYLGRRFQIYVDLLGRAQPGADAQLRRRLFRGGDAGRRTAHR